MTLSIAGIKNPSWLRGAGYTGFAPPLPVDGLSQKPLWAHSVGYRLSATQNAAFRVRRDSDDAEIDIAFTADNFADKAALEAFCDGGAGYIVRVYNAGTVGGYVEQADPAKQVKICDDAGAAIVDARGALVANFVSGMQYTANYAFVGDVSVVLAYDAGSTNPTIADGYFVTGLWNSGGNNEFGSDVFFAAEPNGYAEVGNDEVGGVYAGFDYWTRESNWFQFARVASGTTFQLRAGGSDQTPASWSSEGDITLNADTYAWGWADWGTDQCMACSQFLFGETLSLSDQAILDAWFSNAFVVNLPFASATISGGVVGAVADGYHADLSCQLLGLSPTVLWSQVSGPGVASFADPTAATTTATFDTPGDYVLKCTATDAIGNVVDSNPITVTQLVPGLTIDGLIGPMIKARFTALDLGNGNVALWNPSEGDPTALVAGATQPVRSATAFNGNKPGVTWLTTTDELSLLWAAPCLTGTRPSLFIVGQLIEPAALAFLGSLRNDPRADASIELRCDSSVFSLLRGDSTTADHEVVFDGVQDALPHVFFGGLTVGGIGALQVDFGVFDSVATGTAAHDMGHLNIGKDFGNAIHGVLAEIIALTDCPPAADINAVVALLKAAWGC